MKIRMYTIFLAFLLTFSLSSNSYAILTDWNIDPTGSGEYTSSDIIDVNTLFNISGFGYAENYDVNPTTSPPDLEGTFSNWGFWRATGTDDGTEAFPIGFDYEVTGIFEFGGDVVLGEGLNFTSGTLDIYVDQLSDTSTSNYTTTDDSTTYGADDGTPIASFDVVSGDGFVSESGTITGDDDNVNITYQATHLEPGYWTTDSGLDISDLLADPFLVTLGFSNTTAVTGEKDDLIQDELWTYASNNGATLGPDHSPPEAVYITNNGEFQLQVVPEPTTMLLFGTGLLGLGFFGRRKIMNMNKKA